MNRIGAEERQALRESLRQLLAKESDERAVRATMETSAGYDAGLWKELAELGLVGLLVDEAHGGSGLGPVEIEAVMEEAGAALLCSPLLGSSVLAARLLAELGDEAVNARWLPAIADGSAIAAAALTGPSGTWTPDGVEIDARERDGAWRLTGRAGFVIHGQNADVLLVLARTPDGPACFVVEPAASGLAVGALPTFDHTLRLADVTFEDTPAARIAARAAVADAVRRALDTALVALAGDQVGAARRCFEMTVDYAKSRVQFGRSIGSFQAIKHMAADLLLEVESATSAARHAAERLAADGDDSIEAVSLAAFACADAGVKTAADSIQMHGGIAFTWEHPVHLYLRRARSGAQLFGSPSLHRERFLQALGG